MLCGAEAYLFLLARFRRQAASTPIFLAANFLSSGECPISITSQYTLTQNVAKLHGGLYLGSPRFTLSPVKYKLLFNGKSCPTSLHITDLLFCPSPPPPLSVTPTLMRRFCQQTTRGDDVVQVLCCCICIVITVGIVMVGDLIIMFNIIF